MTECEREEAINLVIETKFFEWFVIVYLFVFVDSFEVKWNVKFVFVLAKRIRMGFASRSTCCFRANPSDFSCTYYINYLYCLLLIMWYILTSQKFSVCIYDFL